jgi:hypothetical protein
MTTNATLSGKKLLAKIVNGVKQPTFFCPFKRLVRCSGSTLVKSLLLWPPRNKVRTF